ncbi:MAG: hypothetical protein JOZ15_21015 [Acidobacteria bacterium]|nr:hypothetical protein [Acidobacteriota bacterium]
MSRIWIPTLVAGSLALRLTAAAGPPARTALRPPAERLPIHVYTVDDGLAGDEINAVLQDSRGFLWIGTDSGLSRFDGTRFAGYDPRQGLPSPNVTTLLEDPSGGLLVGTTGGLARLDPFASSPTRAASCGSPRSATRHRAPPPASGPTWRAGTAARDDGAPCRSSNAWDAARLRRSPRTPSATCGSVFRAAGWRGCAARRRISSCPAPACPRARSTTSTWTAGSACGPPRPTAG